MAEKINDGGAAFPTATGGKYVQSGDVNIFKPDMTDGMSLRDYFAAKATEDDVQNHLKNLDYNHTQCSREQAKFRYADAMIAEREKQK